MKTKLQLFLFTAIAATAPLCGSEDHQYLVKQALALTILHIISTSEADTATVVATEATLWAASDPYYFSPFAEDFVSLGCNEEQSNRLKLYQVLINAPIGRHPHFNTDAMVYNRKTPATCPSFDAIRDEISSALTILKELMTNLEKDILRSTKTLIKRV